MPRTRRLFYSRRRKRFPLSRWAIFLIVSLILLWKIVPERIFSPDRVSRCISSKKPVGILFVIQGDYPSEDIVMTFHYFPKDRYLGVIGYPSIMAVTRDSGREKELFKISEYIRAFGAKKTAKYLSAKLGIDIKFYWVEPYRSFFKKLSLIHGSFYLPILSYTDFFRKKNEPFREIFSPFDMMRFLKRAEPEDKMFAVMNIVNTLVIHSKMELRGEKKFVLPLSKVTDANVLYFLKKHVRTNLNIRELATIFRRFDFTLDRFAFMIFPGGYQEIAGIRYYSPERSSFPYVIKLLTSLSRRRAALRKVELRDAGGGRVGIRKVRKALSSYDTVYTGGEPYKFTRLLVLDRVGNVAAAMDIHDRLSVGEVASWYEPEGGITATVMVSKEANSIVISGESVP